MNYGQLFGGFLNGLGNAFDRKTSFDASSAFIDKTEEEKKEIAQYALRKIAIQNKYSQGRKGKFNTYLVDFFLIGKSKKDWMENLIYEPATSTQRKLQNYSEPESSKVTRKTGFDFGEFFNELKYWLYLASWINKLISMCMIDQRKNSNEVTERFFNYVQISQRIHFLLMNLISVDVVFLGSRTILHTKIVKQIGFYYLWTLTLYSLIILDMMLIADTQYKLVYGIWRSL